MLWWFKLQSVYRRALALLGSLWISSLASKEITSYYCLGASALPAHTALAYRMLPPTLRPRHRWCLVPRTPPPRVLHLLSTSRFFSSQFHHNPFTPSSAQPYLSCVAFLKAVVLIIFAWSIPVFSTTPETSWGHGVLCRCIQVTSAGPKVQLLCLGIMWRK